MLCTYRYTPLVTTDVQPVKRSWIPPVELLQELFKPMLVHVRLPNGVHVIAPLQKKLNSNVYELLFPNQLLVWKDIQGAISND
jgi:hypothetical protein